nr:MOSC domain-containing protein [Peptoniphilus catoniae]
MNNKVVEGRIIDVNISKEKGTSKKPVEFVNLIENYGIENDAHAGKWHRQVSLLAKESIDKMVKDYDLNLNNGDFAENFTTEGIDLKNLKVGNVLQVGDALIEITQIGKECHQGCAIKQKVNYCIMPTEGIFARVISAGKVKRSDVIKVIK